MKILLPILWFVLNVLSFNTYSNNYELKKIGNNNENGILHSQKSANKKSKIYFLPEAFEENVEEDTDSESDLDFFGNAGILDFSTIHFFNSAIFFENKIDKITCNSSPIANSQAKFILYQKIVI